jgi:hypothetical protein
VRIRVRASSQHPLVCRKRRLSRAVLRMRPEKTEVPCHSRSGTIKISPCSNAMSAEHRPKFCSPSLALEPFQNNCNNYQKNLLHGPLNKLVSIKTHLTMFKVGSLSSLLTTYLTKQKFLCLIRKYSAKCTKNLRKSAVAYQ